MPIALSYIVSQPNVFLETGVLNNLPNKRRKEDRVSLNIQGEICGINRSGRIFTGEITIEDVSNVGCRFWTHLQLQIGDVVAIKPHVPGKMSLPDEHMRLFEIVWSERRATSWLAGARKLQGEKLANLKFVPEHHSAKDPKK
jgi:hypothetical protein